MAVDEETEERKREKLKAEEIHRRQITRMAGLRHLSQHALSPGFSGGTPPPFPAIAYDIGPSQSELDTLPAIVNGSEVSTCQPTHIAKFHPAIPERQSSATSPI